MLGMNGIGLIPVQDILAADTRTTEEGNDNYAELEPFVTGIYNEYEDFGKRH